MTRSSSDPGEVIVPFPCERDRVPIATHIRSTMITSSLSTLKSHGLYERYVANLAPAHREIVPNTVAGFWLPIDLGIAHYEACDALHLSAYDLLAMGEGVGRQSQESALSAAVKLVASGGVTPWTVLGQARRFWARAFQGSAISVIKLGPKEARMELAGYPLARIEYNRVSFRGIMLSLTKPFCTKMYVSELSSMTEPTFCAYRLAWA